MLMSKNNKYVRVTEGLNDRGQLISVEDFENQLFNENFSSEVDAYASAYYYNEEHVAQFKTAGTISGITNVLTNNLIFDFDNKNDLNLAKNDAIVLIERLKKENINEKDIEIYFSGNKGFTVVVRIDKLITPEQHKKLAINYFGKSLDTLDKSIYNASRIIRVPNSRHQESNLYKVSISYKQLNVLSIENIRKYAESPKKITKAGTIKLKDELLTKEEPKKINVIETLPELEQTLQVKPSNWKDYKWALFNCVGVKAGERSNSMMVIAATLRAQGYPKEYTEKLLEAFDNKYSSVTKQNESPEMVSDKVKSVYSENWNGKQYSVKNDPWLQAYCERIGIEAEDEKEDKTLTIGDIKEGFIHHIKNLDKNTIVTGIPKLDKAMPITCGMNLGIVGSASSGKTAIALEILKNTSMNNVVSVFVSLDMHRNRLFEKLMMKVSNVSREELYQLIKTEKAQHLFDKVKAEYGNVWFYDRSSTSVENVRDYIKQVESQTGQKVKLVMLDYFERINSNKSDDTAASKDIASGLQDLVNDLDIAMITLVQPNKFSLSGGPDQPILNYTAIKGSSFLYQSFRAIVSIWRPFFTPETKDLDRYLQMAILKNDLGELDLFNFSWSGRKGEIRELEESQEDELRELLKEKARKKDASGTKSDWD